MTRIDQFESAFLGAAKDLYRHTPVQIDHVVVLTDLNRDNAAAYGAQVREALAMLPASEARSWRFVPGPECATIGDVLAIVQRDEPGLVCTYRNLHSGAWRWPHSLSDHVEVLTQVTAAPVCLLPRPDRAGRWDPPAVAPADFCVMAMTDHLAGDNALVDHAVAFAPTGGRLVLSHVEDERTFDRIIAAFAKIPEIDTEVARERLLYQLLREPQDYIGSVRRELAAVGVELEVGALVQLGQRLSTYKSLVESHGVDLLVLRAKDDDQLAMHGISYPLAVELRDIPLLLL